MNLKPIKLILLLVLLLSITLTIVYCCPVYRGDGELGRNRRFSFYQTYEIYFPSFPLKVGKVTQNYHFRGVEPDNLNPRFHFLSKSNQRIRFRGDKPEIELLDDLKISMKLRQNGKEILNLKRVDFIFGGIQYYLATNYSHLIIPFSRVATYDLQFIVDIPKNPPIPLKMQFSLSLGHGCPKQACEEIGWEDLLDRYGKVEQ